MGNTSKVTGKRAKNMGKDATVAIKIKRLVVVIEKMIRWMVKGTVYTRMATTIMAVSRMGCIMERVTMKHLTGR